MVIIKENEYVQQTDLAQESKPFKTMFSLPVPFTNKAFGVIGSTTVFS